MLTGLTAVAAALGSCATPGASLAQAGDAQAGDVVFKDGFERWRDANQRLESTWRAWSRSDCSVVWEGDVRDVCLGPEYKQANPVGAYPYRVHSGENAQQYFTLFAAHHAGVLKVFDVPPGATVRVSAWGQAWSSQEDDPRESDRAADVRMRIGVDPGGGTDPTASSVRWGAPANPLDVWRELPPAETTVGEGGRLTVFLSSNPNYAMKHNDVYWDDVSAVVVRRAGPDLPAGQEDVLQGERAGGMTLAPTPADPILDGMVPGSARPGRGGGAEWPWLAGALGAAVVVLVWSRKE